MVDNPLYAQQDNKVHSMLGSKNNFPKNQCKYCMQIITSGDAPLTTF